MKALDEIKQEFPVFEKKDIAYLDSAASTQKPRCVIDGLAEFYAHSYANVHRGVYELSVKATDLYEGSREIARTFINARSTREIIFTRGTTEGINLVAYSWGRTNINPGDEIVVTICEHHSNFVPWQLLAQQVGATFKVVYLNSEQSISLEDVRAALTPKTKLVACTSVANGLGLELPIKEIINAAHLVGAKVLVDAAQAIAHSAFDVQQLDCDFLAFSGHKIYGPTGIGVLYAKEEILNSMPPFLSGGDMISSVTVEETLFNELPYKFEAGTPNIAGAVGLGMAIKFVEQVGLSAIDAHEKRLVQALEEGLAKIDGLHILGPKNRHKALICFVMDGVHPHDLAQYLDHCGVNIRAGHHCAQPLINYLGYDASARMSFGVYNSEQDVERAIAAVKRAQKFFLES